MDDDFRSLDDIIGMIIEEQDRADERAERELTQDRVPTIADRAA